MKNDPTELTEKDYQDLALHELSEAELFEELNSLQKGFTTGRDQELSRYSHEQKKVSAYLQFYTPTNIPKLHFLLNRITLERRELWKNAPFIDFGAGPGTYTASWVSFYQNLKSEVSVVERGQAMREQAQKFLAGLFPDVSLNISSSVPAHFLNNDKSVLFFGHVLNEMNWSEIKKLIDGFKGQAVLWIEPGTPQAFELTNKLRRHLLEGEFEVLYPCQSSALDCPAGNLSGEWCHQVIRTTWPEWIERRAQKLKIDRRTMPLIAHAYQRKKNQDPLEKDNHDQLKEGDVRQARIVRLKKETKHSFEWDLCLTLGKDLKWQSVSVMKRGLSKKEEKKISHMHTGEQLSFELVKLLEQGLWRVKLVDP
jgi:ribosomal protein RSM22 (predicted rRNA methylase)